MDNVVAFQGTNPEALRPEVNQEVVDYLEDLLDRAKSGNLRAILMCAISDNTYESRQIVEDEGQRMTLSGVLQMAHIQNTSRDIVSAELDKHLAGFMNL